MADTAPPRRRRRWPLYVAAGLAIAIAFAAWQLSSAKLAKTILDRAGPAFGLELAFEGTPSYSLRPEPRLSLPGFVARQPGAETPLLTADRLELSLPWSTITGDAAAPKVITRIDLDTPVLDLAALAAWQATRPDTPFEVPTLTDGIGVDDGTIVGDGWRLTGVELALPHLSPGRPAEAALAGRLERGTLRLGFEGDVALASAGLESPVRLDLEGTLATGGEPMPWTLELAGALDATGTPLRVDAARAKATGTVDVGEKRAAWILATTLDAAIGDATTIDLADAAFRGDEPLPELLFDAHGVIDERLHFDAGGAMARWPGGWPTLPPPLSATRPMSFVLGYDGGTDFAAPLRLRVTRDGTRLDVRAEVPEVLAWMDRDDASPLPPVEGSFTTPTLTVGAFTLDGVRVEFDDGDGVDAAGPFAGVRGRVDSTEDEREARDADASP